MRKLILTLTFYLTVCVFVNAQDKASDKNVSGKKGAAKIGKKRIIFRATKAQITTAQTKLKNAGGFDGEISGRYSKDFRTSLKAYQKANGLKKTGRLDRATLKKMGIALENKQTVGSRDSGARSKRKRRKSFRVNKSQITKAQRMLKEKGLFAGDITGRYSKEFRTAIKNYQSANGLKRKGLLNRATLEKMKIELTDKQREFPINKKDFAKKGAAANKRKAVFRATKEQISKVQKMLKEKGLYKGKETGKFNPQTRAAIREWQSQNNIKRTGTLNKITLEAMGIELTQKQKLF